MSLLLTTTTIGILCVEVAAYTKYCQVEDSMKRRRVLCGCLRTCGNMLIPSVLFFLLPKEDRSCDAVVPAVLWVALVNLVDSYMLFHAESASEDRPASIRMEPTCITGLTFALCGYIGARSDHKYGHLFLYAVIACLACVLPSHNMKPGTLEEQIFESFQKSVLFGCISLLIAGVCLVQRMKVAE